MYSMSSTPLTCCSIGAALVSADPHPLAAGVPEARRVGRPPLLDGPQLPLLRPLRHPPVVDLVLGRHHVDELLPLVGAEGFLRHEDHLTRPADRHPHPDEH